MKLPIVFFCAPLLLSGLAGAQPSPGGTEATPLPPTENVAISIKGTIAGDVPVDFSFTTAGPTFAMQQQLKEIDLNGTKHPILGNCQVVFEKIAGGYRVQYTLSAAIPTITSATSAISPSPRSASSASVATDNDAAVSAGSSAANVPQGRPLLTATISYHQASVNGTVLLQYGKTVTILDSGGKTLTITLTKV